MHRRSASFTPSTLRAGFVFHRGREGGPTTERLTIDAGTQRSALGYRLAIDARLLIRRLPLTIRFLGLLWSHSRCPYTQQISHWALTLALNRVPCSPFFLRVLVARRSDCQLGPSSGLYLELHSISLSTRCFSLLACSPLCLCCLVSLSCRVIASSMVRRLISVSIECSKVC